MTTKEDQVFKDFNDLLSRLDTLHDFCNPHGSRTFDRTVDKDTNKDEFAAVFKPMILKALDSSGKKPSGEKITDPILPSREILQKAITNHIDNIYNTSKSVPALRKVQQTQAAWYKNDLENLLDRTKNGLISVNNMRNIDKKVYEAARDRLSNFEPSVVAFYELMYNRAVNSDTMDIGRFVTASRNDFTYDYTDPKASSRCNFFDKIKNTQIAAFVLGRVDAEPKNNTGIFKYDCKDPEFTKCQKCSDYLYLKRLRSDILNVLKQPHNSINNDTTFNLIVDTTTITFSQFYDNLSIEARKKVGLKVICNVAMDWDAAWSVSCEPGNNESKSLTHESNEMNRAIYDLGKITLEKQQESKTKVTLGSNGTSVEFNKYPRQVNKIAECLRRPETKTCNIPTKGNKNTSLLDIKRSGDALQAIMTQKLNSSESNQTNELSIFVTLDHLAFLKARMLGIPAIFTSQMQDNEKNMQKVMIIFKGHENKAILETLKAQLKTSIKPANRLVDFLYQPKLKPHLPKLSVLLFDQVCRYYFGLNVYLKNGEVALLARDVTGDTFRELIKNNAKTMYQDNHAIAYLNDQRTPFTFTNYSDDVVLDLLEDKIEHVLTHASHVNDRIKRKITNIYDSAINICNNADPSKVQTIDSNKANIHFEVFNKDFISNILQKYVLNTFVIHVFYVLAQCKKYERKEDFDDISSIAKEDIKDGSWKDATPQELKGYVEIVENFNKTFKTKDDIYSFIKFLKKPTQSNQDLENIFSSLFDFQTSHYIDFIEGQLPSLLDDIYKNDISPFIMAWERRFVDQTKAHAPTSARLTRSKTALTNVVDELITYFSKDNGTRIGFQWLSQEQFQNKFFKACENFYMTTVANNHLSRVTDTPPTPFTTAKEYLKGKQSAKAPKSGGGTDDSLPTSPTGQAPSGITCVRRQGDDSEPDTPTPSSPPESTLPLYNNALLDFDSEDELPKKENVMRIINRLPTVYQTKYALLIALKYIIRELLEFRSISIEELNKFDITHLVGNPEESKLQELTDNLVENIDLIYNEFILLLHGGNRLISDENPSLITFQTNYCIDHPLQHAILWLFVHEPLILKTYCNEQVFKDLLTNLEITFIDEKPSELTNYITFDEYICSRFALETDNADARNLLEVNANILKSVSKADPPSKTEATFPEDFDNWYSTVELPKDPTPQVANPPGPSPPKQPPSKSGGAPIKESWMRMSLQDYHKKYYPKYWSLYYA